MQAHESVLVDAHHARYDEARAALAPYAELVSAPEHVHTYRLSAVSVWNALAMGRTAEDVKIHVGRFSRYGIPPEVLANLDGWCSRFGRIRLEEQDGALRLVGTDPLLAREIANSPKAMKLLGPAQGDRAFDVPRLHRGEIKWALVKLGYPVDDHAGFAASEPLPFRERYEVPWKVLERCSFIAEAECVEIQVAMAQDARIGCTCHEHDEDGFEEADFGEDDPEEDPGPLIRPLRVVTGPPAEERRPPAPAAAPKGESAAPWGTPVAGELRRCIEEAAREGAWVELLSVNSRGVQSPRTVRPVSVRDDPRATLTALDRGTNASADFLLERISAFRGC